MQEIFSRTEALIGADAVKKLNIKSVAVFGLGGVGSYCVEALARAGIGQLIICDGDKISPSNINRQLYALHSTIGKFKCDVAEDRLYDINPNIMVVKHNEYFNAEALAHFDLWGVDYFVDCIDDVKGKILLAQTAKSLNKPIICCLGTGNKLSNTDFIVADIFSTEVCPLARVMRRELKKTDVDSLKTVYSKTPPQKAVNSSSPSSISFVPPVAGMIVAGEVIKNLLGANNEKK